MAPQKDINLILACTFKGGIGYKNKLPWYIPSELKKFKEITSTTLDPNKQNAVIMGRKTWESLRYPLKGRKNIVLTRNTNYQVHHSDVETYSNTYDAMMFCNSCDDIETIFIIGGETIYSNILNNNFFDIKSIYLSVMFHGDYRIDSYIDMFYLYSHFKLIPDKRYADEKNRREFASYICIPK